MALSKEAKVAIQPKKNKTKSVKRESRNLDDSTTESAVPIIESDSKSNAVLSASSSNISPDSKDALSESTKAKKVKTEKLKKRKASALVESTIIEPTVHAGEPGSKSTTVITASISTASPALEGDTSSETVKTKDKKEKSTKRKSSALKDPASETAVTSSAPVSSTSDNEATEEPPAKKRKASVDEIEVDINAPEPPSKKALRALKKGKPLPPSKSGAESTPEPEEKKEKKAEVEKRSEHGVWIGNLPFSVSKDILKTFLVEHSDLTPEMITRVHMPGPNDSKPANKVAEKRFGKAEHNKGFAYVDFSTAEGAEWAVELSEQLLSGRRLLIKNHKSFEGRPLKTKEETRKEGKPASKRVFLGNLSYDVTEEILQEHFEKCGIVESVKVATFEDSGKCKGYAWIVFEDLEAAQNAVRGWVLVEEDASDASSSDASDSDSESAEEEKVSKPKKTKKRKVWVNRLKGRPLRMEFAEGADVRYKKRYGKDGTKNSSPGEGVGEAQENRRPAKVQEYQVPTKGVEYDRPYGAPRLTGGIVKSEGKKVTF